MAELDRRLVQLGDDIERERRLAADAEAALDRLAAEEETLRREAAANEAQRAGVDAARAPRPTRCSAAAEKTFGELTGTLADLTARRNALENAVREHGERLARLDRRDGRGRGRAGAARGRDRGPHRSCGARAGGRAAQAAVVRGGSAAHCAPRPRIPPPARRSTWPAGRSPRPSAARSASTPKPRRWRSCCTSTPRICGRR